MIKKEIALIIISVVLGLWTPSLFSQDDSVYLTAYIPAPYAEYNNLETDTLSAELDSTFRIIDEDSSARPALPVEGLVYYEKGTNDPEGFYYYDPDTADWYAWGQPGGVSPWHKDGLGNIFYGVDLLEGNVGIGSDACEFHLDISKGLFIRGDLYTDAWSSIADRGSNTLMGVGVVGAQGLTTGEKETAIGNESLYSITTGVENTAFGYRTLHSNTAGCYNTAFGVESLYSNTTSSYNTAVGYNALRNNTQGTGNTALGYIALSGLNNAASAYNTAMGIQALSSLQSGSYNTAIGSDANRTGTSVSDITAIGNDALETCTGNSNVAVGNGSMRYIKNGTWNTAVGMDTGYGNSASLFGGTGNTIFGYSAGYNLTTGNNNILIGYQAGDSITTGSENIIIGYDQNLPTPDTSYHLNIGGLIYGDFNAGKVGIGMIPSNLAGTAKLQINGGITASAKDFDIVHPDPEKAKDGWRLRHSSVETPTRGDNLYRFQALIESDGGKTEILLPAYWKYLNEKPQVWVYAKDQFSQGYGYLNDTLDKLIVKADKKGTYNVILLGTRKDKDAKESSEEFESEYKL